MIMMVYNKYGKLLEKRILYEDKDEDKDEVKMEVCSDDIIIIDGDRIEMKDLVESYKILNNLKLFLNKIT